jgi:cytoskeletal protein CcmA (bactofilin family)
MTREATNAVPSIIGHEMVVQGDFNSGGELHVEGTIEGDIKVKSLIVGKDAVIRGEIVADTVRVCGTVTGCIRAREVTLAASANMQGDIHHDVISIEAGAGLDGHCRRREAAKAGASPTGTGEPVRLATKPTGEPSAPALGPRPVAVAAGGTP